MKKKSLSKKLNSPIPHMQLDSTEMLLLVFVVIALLAFVSWQQGFIPRMFEPMVLGASIAQ